jgi:hypothetical protein
MALINYYCPSATTSSGSFALLVTSHIGTKKGTSSASAEGSNSIRLDEIGRGNSKKNNSVIQGPVTINAKVMRENDPRVFQWRKMISIGRISITWLKGVNNGKARLAPVKDAVRIETN